MSVKDGGPVFPEPIGRLMADGRMENGMRGGMTLRDYFAAKALEHLEFHSYGDKTVSTRGKDAARYAYEIADAMLKERAK